MDPLVGERRLGQRLDVEVEGRLPRDHGGAHRHRAQVVPRRGVDLRAQVGERVLHLGRRAPLRAARQNALDDRRDPGLLVALVQRPHGDEPPGDHDVVRLERTGQDDGAARQHVPLVIKIAPDMEDVQIETMAGLLIEHGMDGVIATNTTLSRDGVEGLAHADEAGGLSGAPLTARATAVTAKLVSALRSEIPVIASGGVMTAADAAAKKTAGARLVQLYTGLVYRGPRLIDEARAAWRDTPAG